MAETTVLERRFAYLTIDPDDDYLISAHFAADQHQPGGRSDKTVLHHGCGSSRRTFGGRRNYERGADGGAPMSPIFAGFLFSRPLLIGIPFFIAGALKVAYDLILYRQFVAVRPPEEIRSSGV